MGHVTQHRRHGLRGVAILRHLWLPGTEEHPHQHPAVEEDRQREGDDPSHGMHPHTIHPREQVPLLHQSSGYAQQVWVLQRSYQCRVQSKKGKGIFINCI